MRFIILLAIIVTVFSYTGWHTWTMLPLPRLWKCAIIAIYVILFLLLPVSLLAESHLPMTVCAVLDKVSTAWLIILLYLIIAFILVDIARLCAPAIRPLFAANWKGVALIAVAVTGILVYGNINYHHKVRVPLNINIDKPLSRTYRIVFISDLHLGYTIGAKELAQWVELINVEHPDIILIGGDIVDHSSRPVAGDDFASQLRHLDAPMGVYCCLGNHDYYAHTDKSVNFMERSHIKPLIDESVLIDNAFYVVGRDDATNRRRNTLADLTASIGKKHPVILLDHQPHRLDLVQKAGADILLSGHTHRGQVFPINLITDKIYECSHGYIRKGNTHIYVSSGIGIWGGKFRIGSQSEYVVIELSGK